MTVRELQIAGFGPFDWDDDDEYTDDAGLPTGEKMKAIKSSGPIKLELTATPASDEVPTMGIVKGVVGGVLATVKVVNIDDPSELGTKSMSCSGYLICAYQEAAGALDLATLYVWDASGTTVNSPFIVQGRGGVWVALCGRNSKMPTQISNTLAVAGLWAGAIHGIHSGGAFFCTSGMWVGANKVIGAQRTAIADPGDTLTSVISVVKLILAALRGHGLIQG